MKLELDGNPLQQSFVNDYSSDKSGFKTAENEIGDMLRASVKLAQEGNRVEARHLLLRITEAEPGNETAWLWLASISEYPEELLVFLQNVLRINPENARAIEWSKATKSLLAKTFVQRGIDASHDDQMDFAKQCFLQAIVHDAENEMAWLWLASVTDTVEEKMMHLQKVLNFNPENETALSSLKALREQTSQALLRKANSAAIAGERTTANDLLEGVMKDSPDMEEAWILKAYLADEFYEKIRCYEKVLELNPDNEAAQAGMASLKVLIQKVENQVDYSQKIAELSNEESEKQNSQTDSENYRENTADSQENILSFAEESPVSDENFAEFTEQNLTEESFEEVDSYESADYESADKEEVSSYELSENEPESQMPESQMSGEMTDENHLIPHTQIPDLEVSAIENNLSAEESPVSIEQNDFHLEEEVKEQGEEPEVFNSESPTQKLEAMHLLEAEFQKTDEPEIELIDSETGDDEVFSETEEIELSLDMDEESEDYLIDDTQIHNSYILTEIVQENVSFSQPVEETSLESSEQPMSENLSEAEEVYHSEDSPKTDIYETPSTNYFADYNQPTVEFSYNENAAYAAEQAQQPAVMAYASEDYLQTEKAENQYTEEPEEQCFEDENEAALVPETVNPFSETQDQTENTDCPFCGSGNAAQAISCNSCHTILSLSDLEMLLANQAADRQTLFQAIEIMEAERNLRDFNTDELCLLGIAQLNAKNLRKGLTALQEASKLSPNDVVLSSKVNFLAIRLSEIEMQENKNQESSSASRTIMVVDDSATVRKLISGKLEKSGHSVVTAVDGVDALAKINAAVPDLILLDIAMPQMDGYQVCKMIRGNEATKDIPIVMISGKDGFFDKVRGRMAGSTGYITKPFGPETLMRTIESYIN